MGRKRSAATMHAGDASNSMSTSTPSSSRLDGGGGESAGGDSGMPCPYCDRGFDDELARMTHLREKHYRCRMCNRRLASITSLAVHTRQVHKQDLPGVFGAVEDGRQSVQRAIDLERRQPAAAAAAAPVAADPASEYAPLSSTSMLMHPMLPQPMATWVSPGDPSSGGGGGGGGAGLLLLPPPFLPPPPSAA